MTTSTHRGDHDHSFGQGEIRPGERRTRIVLWLTAATMLVEIGAGLAFGSMALLADGVHMASHAAALGIAVIGYAATRRYAQDHRLAFGAGKINALAGFTSAVLLAAVAIGMAVGGVERLIRPVEIQFAPAIGVAVVGLAVNVASVFILDVRHDHDDHGDHPHHDHNLRGAYLHVLADSLTSIAAIVALALGALWGLNWLDPLLGVAGGVLVGVWALSLLKGAGGVLLDRQAPEEALARVRAAIELADDDGGRDQIADLHLWSVGPAIWAAEIVIVSERPEPPEVYRRRLPAELHVVHATIEVRRRAPAGAARALTPECC